MSRLIERRSNTRLLRICSLSDCDSIGQGELRPGFIVMVPAYSDDLGDSLRGLIQSLIRNGGEEFCFVGSSAESFHDALDEQLESNGCLEAVTTACVDESEGVEYFIYGAGAAQCDLLALVGEQPKLVEALLQEFENVPAN